MAQHVYVAQANGYVVWTLGITAQDITESVGVGVSSVVVDDVCAGFLQPIMVVDTPSTVLLVRFNGMDVDRGIVLLDVNVVE